MTDRPLRIGISCFATHGGSGVVAAELSRELARLGHKVHIISFALPFRLESGEFFENIYYHEVGSLAYDVLPSAMTGLELSSKLTQIAEDEQLDVIHAHYAVPHAISGIVAKLVLKGRRNLPIVTTLHGTDITLVGRAPSFFPLTQWAIEQSDAVTTVSQWLREETIRTFQTKRPIEVIRNFVDTKRFQACHCPTLRSHIARPGEKIVLHVSNFRPVKRLPDVIDTFAKVVERVPARLVLIGDGPEREHTLEHARRVGVMNRTYFLGKQASVENYFAIADVLLFPSEYESFGVTALEAMSAAVPVVATQGSGLSEVVVDGETGFLCPVGDVHKMATAVERILTDDDLSRTMGKNGQDRAHTLFEASVVARDYERLYRRVIDSAANSG